MADWCLSPRDTGGLDDDGLLAKVAVLDRHHAVGPVLLEQAVHEDAHLVAWSQRLGLGAAR